MPAQGLNGPMAPKFQYQRLGNLVVAFQSELPATDAEWACYVELYRRIWQTYDSVRILVHSAGGSPTNQQQRQVNELVPGMAVRVAVVALVSSVAQVVRRLTII